MQKHSEFSPQDTESIYQDIEVLQTYLSQEALFFVEELAVPDPHLVGLIFKVKDGELIWQVEVLAPTISEASAGAKDYLIKKFKEQIVLEYQENGLFYN